jgi:DNA mismatch repair protein MSH3
MLRDEAYVPFDIDFSDKDGTAKVITGPNMAGAWCRADCMGASDDIGRGKSTFMVELSETSDILRTLSPRTLVILDE